jgi:MFS family permease
VQAALWIIPCWLVGGLLNGGENVMAGTLLGRRVPREARGRAAAAMQSRVQGGGLIGFVAGGVMLDLFDARWIVLGAGALGLIAVLAVTPVVRRVSAGSMTAPHSSAPGSPNQSDQSPEPEPALA